MKGKIFTVLIIVCVLTVAIRFSPRPELFRNSSAEEVTLPQVNPLRTETTKQLIDTIRMIESIWRSAACSNPEYQQIIKELDWRRTHHSYIIGL